MGDAVFSLSNGQSISLTSQSGALAKTTGWTTWDSAYVLIRYLEFRGIPADKTVLDVSTGNGLVALACSVLGASRVVATEVSDCIDLVEANLILNNTKDEGQSCDISVLEYLWGQDNLPLEDFDFAIICDAVFIAIRDNLESELLHTMEQLCSTGRILLVAFEVRLVDAEEAFLESLRKLVVVSEVNNEELNFSDLRGTGDLEDLFWEPPSIRLFRCQKQDVS